MDTDIDMDTYNHLAAGMGQDGFASDDGGLDAGGGSGSDLQGPLDSHPPDSINDTSSALERTDTASSSTDASDKLDSCRICRSEGTPEEPLFYPCKCSGSIKFVHQECLMEWLSHSHKKHCELCKTPFRFTKLYDADMPQKLPWAVFGKRAGVHVASTIVQGCRAVMVTTVWLIILPWLVRWAWRWMFWVSDAGWARESFVVEMQRAGLQDLIGQGEDSEHNVPGLNDALTLAGPKLYQLAKDLVANSMGLHSERTNAISNSTNAPFIQNETWPPSDTSVLSSWTYLSELTSNAHVNRIFVDIFEGQLITCVVIVGFILVFLIREWVVQQQPLVNLDNLAHVQAHLREAAERVQADNDRLRRQQELLEQARRRLLELQNETNDGREIADEDEVEPWLGWEGLETLINDATAHLRGEGEEERQHFERGAQTVIEQIQAAGRAKRDVAELTDKLSAKLAGYSVDERRQWEGVLMAEVRKMADRTLTTITGQRTRTSAPHGSGRRVTFEDTDVSDGATASTNIDGAQETTETSEMAEDMQSADPEPAEGEDDVGRPPMPDRDFSSKATQIQRLLEEAEEIFQPQTTRADTGSNVDGAVRQRPVVTFDLTPTVIPRAPSGSDDSAAVSIYRDVPITNAGPDAKINIMRRGPGLARPIPAPKDITDVEKKKRQDEDDAMKKLEDEISAEDGRPTSAPETTSTTNVVSVSWANLEGSSSDASGDEADPQAHAIEDTLPQHSAPSQRRDSVSGIPIATPMSHLGLSAQHTESDQVANNTGLPDGLPTTERRHSETLSHRVASAFREEFGLDEAEELENLRQMGLGADGETALNDGRSVRAAAGPPGYFQGVTNWFWGDIQGENANEAPIVSNEEREDAEQEAPFVPVQLEALQPPPAPVVLVHDHQDPEVLAAAAQAGLDADAIEDAEDLEGIFELIGLQGPLLGLFQTSTFCTILVTATVFGAVGLPYVWGKVVLNFIGDPVFFLIQMPLQVASVVADFCVDVTLLAGGWLVFVMALAMDFLLAGLQTWAPTWLGRLSKMPEWVSGFAMATAGASGSRLQSLIMTEKPMQEDILGWNWAILGASVHAHASLKYVESEIDAILDYAGSTITAIAETVSTGTTTDLLRPGIIAYDQVWTLPAKLFTSAEALKQYSEPLLKSLGLLRTGSFTFETPVAQPIDPTLIYWDSTDRSLAVLAGYLSLAALAAVYVAIDQPITRSEEGRKREKLARDTLRQAGGVLKVILIISIEMLVFPLYCGLLLDLAFLPLFQDASVATRWAFARDRATLFCFVHWFIGTCYMFHFALFVGMCRKILRKGVLWFIRDPDDPTFHPVRDVLERNVTTQLRKIAFSALVYGALVILCLGGVIWSIGQVFHGIFPIRWVSTEPVLEFPMDLLLYNAVTPLLIRLFKPSDGVNAMYAWWLRRCARVLRLSHFLFDDRRTDEERELMAKTWTEFLLMRPSSVVPSAERPATQTAGEEGDEAILPRDGKYVLTPCNDQYRPPKAGEAFLYYAYDDVYISDKDGKKNDHFAKVFVPSYFRLRITLFMVCLWMFSAFTGLCATLVPLCFGRQIFATLWPAGVERVNDIYAYTVGSYILGGLGFVALQSGPVLQKLRQKSSGVDVWAWITPAKRYSLQALKCVYFYGFLGLVLPTIFALLLQFYFILPLHTYVVTMAARGMVDQPSSTAASAIMANMTTTATSASSSVLANSIVSNATQAGAASSTLAEHTIHILQDYCLGLLYVRLATRFILTTPASRAAEAFRRITVDGYLNPNVRLATRFLIAPISLLATTMLLFPPVFARLTIIAMEQQQGHHNKAQDPTNALDSQQVQAEWQTKVYRYSYPAAAGMIMLMLGGSEIGKATSRWRARIRDEVYLVGERLHNFGERKPPPHSKSVVRKER